MLNVIARIATSVVIVVASCIIVDQIQKRGLVDKAINKITSK